RNSLADTPPQGTVPGDSDGAGIAGGDRKHDAGVFTAGDGKNLAGGGIGGGVVNVVEDGHRDVGGIPGALYAQQGGALLLFVSGQFQLFAAGFGLGPDRFIDTAAVDHIFAQSYVPGVVPAD